MKKNDETYNQIFVCSFLKKVIAQDKRFIFFSVPNGGSRNKAEAQNLKLSGLRKGVADICLIGHNIVHFIEYKKPKGILSLDQKEFIEEMGLFGWGVTVIYADTPKEAIEKTAQVLIDIFGYTQNGISNSLQSSLSNCDSLGGGGLKS